MSVNTYFPSPFSSTRQEKIVKEMERQTEEIQQKMEALFQRHMPRQNSKA